MQVSMWNGGIDVSRKAIVSALRAGDNVMVAMDGIAGMFASRKAGDKVGQHLHLLGWPTLPY